MSHSPAPPRVRFFIAAHKPCPLPSHPLFTPIGLGGYRPEGRDDALCDTDGDNIAARNPHYGELTGWYWIWKHVRDLDMVGLCHYRRYFLLAPGHPQFAKRRVSMPPTEENMARLAGLDPMPLVSLAHRENAVIVPRPVHFHDPLREQYLDNHRPQDWELFRRAVRETSPAHAAGLEEFEASHWLYPYNMMVAPWPFFADYMAALMAMLERLHALIDYPDDPYQRRAPGFLAERFFTLHLLVTRQRRIETPTVTTDQRSF